MMASVVTVDKMTPSKEIAARMAKPKINAVPVLILGRHLSGVVSESDDRVRPALGQVLLQDPQRVEVVWRRERGGQDLDRDDPVHAQHPPFPSGAPSGAKSSRSGRRRLR